VIENPGLFIWSDRVELGGVRRRTVGGVTRLPHPQLFERLLDFGQVLL
jgi:hypothetical protein